MDSSKPANESALQMNGTITFDKSAQESILAAFGFAKDAEGYLVEKANPKQRVLSPDDGSEVRLHEFAGVQRGSIRVIKSDISSLIELLDRLRK